MLINRLNEIRSQASQALELLNDRAASWGARLSILGTGPIAYCMPTAYWIADRKPYGAKPIYDPVTERALKPRAKGPRPFKASLHVSALPLITTTEHDWLLKNGFPGIAKLTRLDPHADSWIDHAPFIESKPTAVKEIWVGARSMKTLSAASRQFYAVPEETPDKDEDEDEDEESHLNRREDLDIPVTDDTPEGHSASALEQEDAAELTELQFATTNGLIEDPDTGETRRIRYGDVLTIAISNQPLCITRKGKDGTDRTFVYGLNQDLDALYLEEGDDPRRQTDVGAYGSDHTWSDRFRGNTHREDEFFEFRGNWAYKGTKIIKKRILEKDRYKAPNTSLKSTGLAWQPDELTLRRIAQQMAGRMIERNPNLTPLLLNLTDEAERKLRNMSAKVRFEGDEGLIQGYFLTRDEFFGTLDSLQMQWDRECARTVTVERKFEGDERPRKFTKAKEAPSAVDWDAVRTPEQRRKRRLQAV